MTEHETVGREEWQKAREELLAKEKELTRRGDELAAERQSLPWVLVDKEYSFETDDGTKTLAELFDGRSQLLMYHFMFGPAYDAGCRMCSAGGDNYNANLPHLNARDVTFLCCSRAPLERLQAYKQRMGWSFPWVSSEGSEFNFDFGVSQTDEQVAGMLQAGELPPVVNQMAAASGTDAAGYLTEGPGLSVFALSDGGVYQTYSTYARGLEIMLGFYPLLDRVPRGRHEDEPEFWVRRHDEY